MKRIIPTLLALAAAWPAAAGEAVNQQIEAAPDGEVAIEVVRGRVTVEGWDQNSVSVQGTRDEHSEEFTVAREGKVITIEDEVGSWDMGFDGGGTDITVKVPRRSSVSVSVVAADIDVRGIAGSLSAETVSGSITAERLEGDARLQSVSGDLRVVAASARVDAESVSGNVVIDNGSPLMQADVSTVSGDITLISAVDPMGDVELESVSGDVILKFRGTVDARIDAETGPGGDIEYGLGDTAPDRERYTGAESLETRLGHGGANVDVSVISGTIRISRD